MPPYIGEIRMFAGNFPPVGWMFCDGQLLPISENSALYTLIGTAYGGDGEETFALPNLAGRVPMHQGNGHILSEAGGVTDVTLTTNNLPSHSHPLIGSTANGAQAQPNNAILASSVVIEPYTNQPPDSPMAPNSLSPVGGSQPHTNLQPYLAINFIISLFGEFPNFS
jgi:microcystin-dependent protein